MAVKVTIIMMLRADYYILAVIAALIPTALEADLFRVLQRLTELLVILKYTVLNTIYYIGCYFNLLTLA